MVSVLVQGRNDVPPVQGVSIEGGNPVHNHSIVTLTDALAVYATYGALAPSLTLAQTGQLLQSASATNNRTLENALDALRALINGADALTTTKTTTDDRDALYTNLYALQNSAGYQALKGNAVAQLSATLDRDTLASRSRSDFGYLLAVKYLLPVVLEGAAGTLGTIHADLYADWQADRTAAPGVALTFTDRYLADRAALLSWKNKLALEDADAATTAYDKDNADNAWFRDNASNLTLNLGGQLVTPANKRRFIFDGDGAATLSGGSQADALYGGGGNDTLYGFDGDDYLEGNAGIDTLEGSDNNDTLIGGSGDDTLDGGADADRLEGGAGDDRYLLRQAQAGDDVIRDSDGVGRILLDGSPLGGGDWLADGVWEKDGIRYLFTPGGDGRGTLRIISPAGRISVEGYANNELGIILPGAPPPSAPPPGQYRLVGPYAGGENIRVSSAGQNIAATLIGGPGVENIIAGNRDDLIYADLELPLDDFLAQADLPGGTDVGDLIWAGDDAIQSITFGYRFDMRRRGGYIHRLAT